MLNVILRNLKYLLNTISERSLGLLKVYWHQNFLLTSQCTVVGQLLIHVQKGVSLPSGPRFAQPIGRVAGLQVSLENSHVQGNGIALVAVISAVEFAILQYQEYISKTD